MKNERLIDALEKVDEDLIAEAAPGNKPPKKNAKTTAWVKWGAMAACALVVVGIGVPFILSGDRNLSGGGDHEETQLEGNIGDITSDGKVQNEAGEGETNLDTMANMTEVKIKIDEIFPDGFRGTIEVGTDVFKEGEQITVVAQDNVTVVQKDGSIFDYDELEPNIKESDLAVGNSVWVGFQTFDYVVGNGKYNQIFAYHMEAGEVRDGNGVNYGEGEPSGLAKGITINNITEPLDVMLPRLSEDNRTTMTSEELYDYYGVNISSALELIGNFEDREGGHPKGLYSYADGSCFDMNQFVFYEPERDYTLCVSIGRNTKCCKLISNLDANAKSSEINGIEMQIYKLEIGEDTQYYATFVYGDCDFIIWGENIDEDEFEKVLGTITK